MGGFEDKILKIAAWRKNGGTEEKLMRLR